MAHVGPKEIKAQPVILKEDEKIPLFLIKLWNIVEDPTYHEIVKWDNSGFSFHIMDPYSFCKNVLPQYFKHNNLNSLIRQLNMYGFRKMTPIDRTSLARAESDHDHLEFSHPCFVRDQPELLVNIKRKAPTGRQQQHSDNTVSVATKDLSAVFDELHRLRERQKDMETKMGDLLKENEMVWQEFGHMRGAHVKQQQITTKLVQFMVALLQPSKRLGKRHLLAIDEFQPKRARESDEDLSLQAVQQHNVGEVLDRLMQEYGVSTSPMRSVPNQLNIRPSNPIISEVTGEEETPRTKQGGYSYSNQYQPQPAQTSQAYMGYDQSRQNMPSIPTQQSMNGKHATNNPRQPPLALHAPIQQPPVIQQQSVIQPQYRQTQRASYATDGDPLPIVNSPGDHVSLATAVTNEDPIITSPQGPLNFSPTQFANYLGDGDSSIEHCRSLIGDTWNDIDFDELLNDPNIEMPVDNNQAGVSAVNMNGGYSSAPYMDTYSRTQPPQN